MNGSPLGLSVRRSAPEFEGLHTIVICSSYADGLSWQDEPDKQATSASTDEIP